MDRLVDLTIISCLNIFLFYEMAAHKSSWRHEQKPEEEAFDGYGRRVYSVDSLVSKESSATERSVGCPPVRPPRNPTYTSACARDFAVLGVVFNFYGIQLFDDHKAFMRLPKLLLFSCLISACYAALLAMLCSVAVTEGLTAPSMRFAHTVVYNVLANVEVVWIYAVLFRQQHVIQEIFDHLSRISRDLVAEDSKLHGRIRRYCIAFVVVIALLVVGALVYTWTTLVILEDSMSSEPWRNLGVRHCLTDDCWGNDTKAADNTPTVVEFNSVHLALIFSADYVIRLPLYAAFIAFCILLAHLVSGHFAGLQDRYGLGKNRDCTDCGHVHDLIERHHSLTKVIKLFDIVFRQPLLIWSFEEFVNLVFVTRTLNLHRNADVGTRFDIVVVLSSVALFILKLAFVSYMNKQVISTLQGLTVTAETVELEQTPGRLLSEVESHKPGQCQRFLIDTQIELYIRHITLQPPAVTGMGLFTIYSGVILTACGQSLTYILALYGIPD